VLLKSRTYSGVCKSDAALEAWPGYPSPCGCQAAHGSSLTAQVHKCNILSLDGIIGRDSVRQNLTEPDGDSGGFSRQIQRHGFCRLPTSLTVYGAGDSSLSKKVLADAIPFTVDLLIRGPQSLHEKVCHRECDFSFTGEDGIGSRFPQSSRLSQVSCAR
jgi:hypothetical protein